VPAAFVHDAVRPPFYRYDGALAADRTPGPPAEVLRRDRLRWGVAAIRIGVGPGRAAVLENTS
jgi:hypothetical protein